MDTQTTSDDVIIEQNIAPVSSEPTTDSSVTTEAPKVEENKGEVKVEGKVDSAKEPTADRDDYWKNKFFEAERKFNNIPKIIEETIIKTQTQQQKPQEHEWTIAELEAYKQEHPEHAHLVEEKKIEILEKRIEKTYQKREEEQKKQMMKAQSEMAVITNPKYAEAFVKTPDGRTLFNEQSPLAHLIHQYYNDPRLAGQPDALEIASKLAFADYHEQVSSKQQVTLQTVQRENAKLKQQTLVESGGVQNVVPSKDAFASAVETLQQPYGVSNRKQAESAVSAFFQKYRKE